MRIADDLLPPPAPRGRNLDALLRSATRGPELIELASALSALNPTDFARQVRAHLSLKALKDQPPTERANWLRRHDALLALQPLGIVTMNIDRMHESVTEPLGWNIICPLDQSSEQVMGDTVRALAASPFVLQAHGELTEVLGRPHHGLVFTWESYRDLVATRPAYIAFMIHLFTTCNFLFAGYGLSDLDFDQLLWLDATRFGRAIQRHVTFQEYPDDPTKKAETDALRSRLEAAAAISEERYGIHTIWLDSWAQMPEVLEAARSTAGPALQATIDLAFSIDSDDRHEAHDRLRMLGENGKATAARVLLDEMTASTDMFRHDEAIMSLGHLRPADSATKRFIADTLLHIAATDSRISAAAHALVAVEPYLEESDLPTLEAISRRVRATTLVHGSGAAWERDTDGRLPVYAEYLIRRTRARYDVSAARPEVPTFS